MFCSIVKQPGTSSCNSTTSARYFPNCDSRPLTRWEIFSESRQSIFQDNTVRWLFLELDWVSCSSVDWSVKDLPQYACCKGKLECFVWVDLDSVGGECIPWIGGVCVDSVWKDWSWGDSVWVDWSQADWADAFCEPLGSSRWAELACEVAGKMILVFWLFFLFFDPAELFSRCSGRCCEGDNCSAVTRVHSLSVFIWHAALCLFLPFLFFFLVFPLTMVSTRHGAVSLQYTGSSLEQVWLEQVVSSILIGKIVQYRFVFFLNIFWSLLDSVRLLGFGPLQTVTIVQSSLIVSCSCMKYYPFL